MHLGIELQNRIDHLQMFASRSEKYEEISLTITISFSQFLFGCHEEY